MRLGRADTHSNIIAMKNFTKLFIVAAAMLMATTVSADRLITNTVTPKDLAAYDEQTVDLTVYR